MQTRAVKYLPDIQSLLISLQEQGAVFLLISEFAELATLSESQLSQLTIGFAGTALCLNECDLHISIMGLITSSESLLKIATKVIVARHSISLN